MVPFLISIICGLLLDVPIVAFGTIILAIIPICIFVFTRYWSENFALQLSLALAAILTVGGWLGVLLKKFPEIWQPFWEWFTSFF